MQYLSATSCYAMLRFALQRHAMQGYVRGRCAMPCLALQIRCCDILRLAVLFYAMPDRSLQCI
eukprot:3510756-Pyramimonas_sp.AAC.1